MSDKFCWICRRNKEDLLKHLPKEFWDEKLSLFFEFNILGKPVEVTTVSDSAFVDKSEDGKLRPPKEKVGDTRAAYRWTHQYGYDSEEFGMFLLKGSRGEINLCRICIKLILWLANIVGKELGSSLNWERESGLPTGPCLYSDKEMEEKVKPLLEEKWKELFPW